MPRLSPPFALVGAAAGWLVARFFDNPLLDRTPSDAAPLAALAAGAIGAVVGHRLQRRASPEDPWLTSAAVHIRVAVHVFGGGLAAGGLVGGIVFANEQGILSGLAGGLAGGLAFLPVCLAVVSAARRAARARLGSLVAGADRRELWSALLAALAVTTSLALIDWPAGRTPHVALALSVSALAVALVLLALDVRAAFALRRAAVAAAGMERRERPLDEGEPLDAAPAVDLGLGTDVHARMRRGGSAYRAHERASALLLGSVDEARAAVRRALAVKALAVGIALAVLGAHAVATGRRAAIAYHFDLCQRDDMASCSRAAALLVQGTDDERARGASLGAYACSSRSGPDADGCRIAAENMERDRTDLRNALLYRESACLAGDVESCHVIRGPRPR